MAERIWPGRTLSLVVGLAAIGLLLAGWAARAAFAQAPTPPAAVPPSHEQMHAMMDAMHGVGASERMHEAMGPDAERLMDQCAAMMGMMGQMMGSGGMNQMMGGGDPAGGAADRPAARSIQDMMRRMMGRWAARWVWPPGRRGRVPQIGARSTSHAAPGGR